MSANQLFAVDLYRKQGIMIFLLRFFFLVLKPIWVLFQLQVLTAEQIML